MAPNRQRGDGPSSRAPRQYDMSRFVSEATSKQFHSLLVNKALISERGIMPQEYQHRGIVATITEHA